MNLNIHYNIGGFDPLTYVINKEVFQVKEKGWSDIPTDNGIGLEFDENMVRKIDVERSEAWRRIICCSENGELREW